MGECLHPYRYFVHFFRQKYLNMVLEFVSIQEVVSGTLDRAR